MGTKMIFCHIRACGKRRLCLRLSNPVTISVIFLDDSSKGLRSPIHYVALKKCRFSAVTNLRFRVLLTDNVHTDCAYLGRQSLFLDSCGSGGGGGGGGPCGSATGGSGGGGSDGGRGGRGARVDVAGGGRSLVAAALAAACHPVIEIDVEGTTGRVLGTGIVSAGTR